MFPSMSCGFRQFGWRIRFSLLVMLLCAHFVIMSCCCCAFDFTRKFRLSSARTWILTFGHGVYLPAYCQELAAKCQENYQIHYERCSSSKQQMRMQRMSPGMSAQMQEDAMYRDARLRGFLEGGMVQSPSPRGYGRELTGPVMSESRIGTRSPVATMATLAAQQQHQHEMPVQVCALRASSFLPALSRVCVCVCVGQY
jgi:hypothetical protein